VVPDRLHLCTGRENSADFSEPQVTNIEKVHSFNSPSAVYSDSKGKEDLFSIEMGINRWRI